MEMLPVKAVADTSARLTVPARDAEKIRIARSAISRLLRRFAGRPPRRPSETYHLLTGLSHEAVLLLLAKTKSEPVKRQVSAYLTSYQHVKPALTGDDLKTMGLKPGPIYKKILERLLDARLNGEVNSKRDERELVKQMANL